MIQEFYDGLAPQYDKLFADWSQTTTEQAVLLHRLFARLGYDQTASVLDCACGIGTQAIGLAALGYRVHASDISEGALAEAQKRAADAKVQLTLVRADLRALSDTFPEAFDLVLAMDNVLPHMLTHDELAVAVKSITGQVKAQGAFIGSIRDYDSLLADKPPYSPPYIYKTAEGQRVAFQTWHWQGERYRLVQYILEDGDTLTAHKFTCEYRATRRAELTELFLAAGMGQVTWLPPEETGFYQPIIVAKK